MASTTSSHPITSSAHCGWCHTTSDSCPRILWCGEGGAADHRAPAVMVVEYVIDESGGRDFIDGDITHHVLHVCGHAACVGSAENHAGDVGLHVVTRELTAQDVADATGYELVGA